MTLDPPTSHEQLPPKFRGKDRVMVTGYSSGQILWLVVCLFFSSHSRWVIISDLDSSELDHIQRSDKQCWTAANRSVLLTGTLLGRFCYGPISGRSLGSFRRT
ncbi:hypothetical protein BDM02DRAFT_2735589 [Thelephora ganbajun]|uniref:Uncharacterized protein n=1 Tax=Thelephora ganbajun TaxID=370292 RepID=A0ACB6ZCX9_THEGA|nr:hypothetical protein BDM02DRAFT_2735589 [Thelephora ganbajun]